MRYIVTFQGSGTLLSLPIAYHHAVQSLLYSALAQDPMYSENLHNHGFRAGNREFRLFTFGPLVGEHVIREGRILFFGDVSLEVRSPVLSFAPRLASALLPGSSLMLAGQNILVTGSRIAAGGIDSGKVFIRMLSPIVVYRTTAERKTVYYEPFQPEFQAGIQQNFIHKYEAFTGTTPAGSINLQPLSVNCRDKEVTHYKDFYITGWRGEYLLTGKPSDLNFLYQAGIGGKNAQGFGMFEPKAPGQDS